MRNVGSVRDQVGRAILIWFALVCPPDEGGGRPPARRMEGRLHGTDEPCPDTWSLRLTGAIQQCAAVDVPCPDQHFSSVALRGPVRITRGTK